MDRCCINCAWFNLNTPEGWKMPGPDNYCRRYRRVVKFEDSCNEFIPKEEDV